MTQRRPRIVKPRSAKQRAQARRYSARSAPIVIVPKDTGLPDCSWWTYVSPEGFTRIAQTQSRRMRLSQFGTVLNPSFGDEA